MGNVSKQFDKWISENERWDIGCWFETEIGENRIIKCKRGFAAIYDDDDRIVYATEPEEIDRLFEEFLEKRAKANGF